MVTPPNGSKYCVGENSACASPNNCAFSTGSFIGPMNSIFLVSVMFAVANYSMDRVAKLYDLYFRRLQLANQPEGWIKPNEVNQEDLYWWDTIPA